MTITARNARTARIASLAEKAAAAQFAIYDANRALNTTPTASPRYATERNNIDLAVLLLGKAKWHAGRYSGTHVYIAEHTADEEDATQAALHFERAGEVARESEGLLAARDPQRENMAAERYRSAMAAQRQGAEILFAGDVPVVPSICPIVILRGSSYEMGRQYLDQTIDIFGAWIYRQLAARVLADREVETVKEWHRHVENCAPEILEMARGWADAAEERGIPLSYWNVVQLWTGQFPPVLQGIRGHGVRELTDAAGDDAMERADASYLGGQSTTATGETSVDLCSGCCAWGDATASGKLVVGATTDHDCTFQTTIVAFPDEGNAFIYTPFSVNGFIPGLGQYFFAGHPGMNNKGLAYVHHGGGLHGIEAPQDRGYGLRRGASVFHNLRFANSARQAQSNELAWPVGDVGTILGSVGGFYADSSYAYVCEARPSASTGTQPIIREFSYDMAGRRHDFLYANNNSMHPRSSGGFLAPAQGYEFNPIEGWVSDKPAMLAHLGEKHLAPAMSTKSSQGRNRYLFDALKAGDGNISVDTMVNIFGTSAPERYRDDGQRMTHKEREHAWATGKDWPSSICHRVNAFTAVLQPDSGSDGLYMGCIGPANRRALMHIPGHGYYYHDEANEFWEIRLKSSPEEMVADASLTANCLVEQAEEVLSAAVGADPGLAASGYFGQILARAKAALEEGRAAVAEVRGAQSGGEVAGRLSRALRRFTTSQVRAKQLITELAFRHGTP